MDTCLSLHCPLPGGTSRCHCSSCHRTFSGVSAFDVHHVLGGPGITCLDPARRGLVSREAGGQQVWGWPEREPGWAGLRGPG